MERSDLGRVTAFTDGVMAVAITLLVLNLEVPHAAGRHQLNQALVDLLPSVGAYLLSFAMVGRFWMIHHRMFERLRSFDGTLVTLNMLFLALIVLIPFATELNDEYSDESIGAAVLAGVLGLAASVNWYMRRYIVRAGLLEDRDDEEASRAGNPVALGLAAVFLLSVPVAFLGPHLAQAMWVSTIVLRYPLRRLGSSL